MRPIPETSITWRFDPVMDPEIADKLAALRKLERQAKQLLYKMERIEAAWNVLKKELKEKGKEIPHHLGDVLHGWRSKSK